MQIFRLIVIDYKKHTTKGILNKRDDKIRIFLKNSTENCVEGEREK